MAWVSRDTNHNINGVFANEQVGYADEQLADNDASVLAYLAALAIPNSVTPRQARLVLLGAGLLDAVNAALTSAGGANLITWEYASVINRSDPLIDAISVSLGLTSAQTDALFVQASTL